MVTTESMSESQPPLRDVRLFTHSQTGLNRAASGLAFQELWKLRARWPWPRLTSVWSIVLHDAREDFEAKPLGFRP